MKARSLPAPARPRRPWRPCRSAPLRAGRPGYARRRARRRTRSRSGPRRRSRRAIRCCCAGGGKRGGDAAGTGRTNRVRTAISSAAFYPVQVPANLRHVAVARVAHKAALEGVFMSVKEQLARLAAFEPAPYPVVSLYLNTQPGQTGRDQFQTFVRKEFAARSRTYPAGSPDRESLDKDLEKISAYLEGQLDAAANGVAVFACSAAELFEAVQLSAPIDQHWLYIGDQPHLYPLARIESLYPRHAAVLADTNSARILVLAAGEVVS